MEGINIDKLHPSPGDIIIISFDTGKYDLDECNGMFQLFKDTLPKGVSCIGVPAGSITDIISIKESAIETIDEVTFR